MSDHEMQGLIEDIKSNGLRDPIITHQGMILDGRNRHAACLKAGVTPRFEEYDGEDALKFVISHNLHRRHLNEAQRGMVAAKMANLQHGGDRKSDEIKSAKAPLITQSQASEMLNIGVDSIKRAKTVMKNGIEELQEMVSSGDIGAVPAAIVAKLPEDQQRKAVAGGIAGVKAAAKQAKDNAPQLVTQSPPQSNVNAKNITIKECNGMAIFASAKIVMERLNPTDQEFKQSLESMIAYCQNRITNQK